MEYVLEILAIVIASSVVMIMHELAKSVMYVMTGRHCLKEDRRDIFKIYRYIDPVGLILFVICHGASSRPYPYRLKERDTNAAIGMMGLLSLALMTVLGFSLYYSILMRFPVVFSVGIENPGLYMLIKICWYFIYASIAMFVVNLFPTTASDMFLLVVAASPSKLKPLLKNDSMVKVVLLLCLIFGYVQSWSLTVMNVMFEFLGFI